MKQIIRFLISTVIVFSLGILFSGCVKKNVIRETKQFCKEKSGNSFFYDLENMYASERFNIGPDIPCIPLDERSDSLYYHGNLGLSFPVDICSLEAGRNYQVEIEIQTPEVDPELNFILFKRVNDIVSAQNKFMLPESIKKKSGNRYLFSANFMGTGNEISFHFGYFDKIKILSSQTSHSFVYDQATITDMMSKCELKTMQVNNIRIIGGELSSPQNKL